MSKCSFLEKYNYPFHLEDKDIGEWYKNLCDACPLTEYHCFEEWPVIIQKKLRRASVPCPHCGATGIWFYHTEDGIGCRYCGERKYHTKPLKYSLQGGANRQHGYE